MEIWLAIIVPIVAVLFLYWKFPSKIAWWEAIIPFVATALIILLFKWWGTSSLTWDKEYLGYYVTDVTWTQEWDEWDHQTCYHTVKTGKNSSIRVPYDCSHRDYHSEYFEATLSNGDVVSISSATYQRLSKHFGNKQFVDMNRNYYKIDGDRYVSKWKEGDKNSFEFYADYETYTNKPQAVYSTFHLQEVDTFEARKYKLYEYPEISDDNKLNAVLHPEDYKVTKEEQLKFDYINGFLGKKKEVRVWVLIFVNQGNKVGDLQRSYWMGGNMNEFVTCIGVDEENVIQWSEEFSWSKSDKLEKSVSSFLKRGEKLNLSEFGDFLYKEVDKSWVRRDFESDFDYINIEVPTWAIVTTWIVSIAACIGLAFWMIFNGTTNVHDFSPYNFFKRKEKEIKKDEIL